MSVPHRSLRRFLAALWRGLVKTLRPLGGKRPAFLVFDPSYRGQLRGAPWDPLRAEKVLAFLLAERLVDPEEVSQPLPAAMKNLLLAHSERYLESLEEPEVLTGILGIPVSPGEEEKILALQRLAVGGTIQATRLALASGGTVFHLGGGFHHAGRQRGSGFCIFNDIAVAVLRLRQRGFSGKVLVVDLDLHDGNGTREIFAQDESVFTLSIHNRHWDSTQAVASLSLALGEGVEDAAYLSTVARALGEVTAQFRPELLVYVAGADVAADDALGNWRITPEGVLARDQQVLGLARTLQVPTVVLLGGGYGEGAWRYPARMIGWWLSGEVPELPADEVLALARLRQLAQLASGEGDEESWGLGEEDLADILPGLPGPRRFLGAFTQVQVELMLERMGLLQQIRARGFPCPHVSLELDHPLGQTLRIYGEPGRHELLVELRLARTSRAVPGFELVSVEWLLLQNPRASFTPERPPLPGQQYPGLGLLAEVFAWLVLLCEREALDGLTFRPSHYHLASLARRHATFLHPEHAALFAALAQLLAGRPLAEASALVAGGRVVNRRTGQAVVWEAFPMVVPVSHRLRAMVCGEDYERAVQRELAQYELELLPEDPGSAHGQGGS